MTNKKNKTKDRGKERHLSSFLNNLAAHNIKDFTLSIVYNTCLYTLGYMSSNPEKVKGLLLINNRVHQCSVNAYGIVSA